MKNKLTRQRYEHMKTKDFKKLRSQLVGDVAAVCWNRCILSLEWKSKGLTDVNENNELACMT